MGVDRDVRLPAACWWFRMRRLASRYFGMNAAGRRPSARTNSLRQFQFVYLGGSAVAKKKAAKKKVAKKVAKKAAKKKK